MSGRHPLPADASARSVLRWSLRSQRGPLTLATVLVMLWQACESLVPVAIGAIIDHAVLTGRVRDLVVSVAALAALFAVLSLSFRFGWRIYARAGNEVSHALRVGVASTSLDPAASAETVRHAGTTVWIAGSDADRVGDVCWILPRLGGALVALLVTAVALLRISVPLGLMVLVGAPLLLLAAHLLSAPLERRSATEQAYAAEAGTLATDLVLGLRVLTGFGGQAAARARYVRASRRSLGATVRAASSEAVYQGVTLLLTLLFLALVTLVGGRLAAQDHISIGQLVAAVGLAQFLLGPLSTFAGLGAVLARARASADRVAGVLRRTPSRAATATLPDAVAGDLTLDGPRPGEALHVVAGEVVGLAADPETSAALVAALSGAAGAAVGVRVDGVALTDLDPVLARRTVLVAAHDAVLFDDTVRANVAVAAAPGLVDGAVDAAAVGQVAETLPAGLDAGVGERGQRLSGGQRQRVALARALATGAPVLVLHEPTTAVDAVTEERIAQGVRRLRDGSTTLLVTTSAGLLAVCDRVVHVGVDAVESGRHDELAATSDAYRGLVLR